MALASAISRIRTGEPSGLGRARARTARQAYSALAEIFMSAPGHGPVPRSSPAPDRPPSQLAAVERVEAALGLRLAGPPARPLVVALGDRPGAGPAADRREAPVVHRVVRDIVGHDEGPDVP